MGKIIINGVEMDGDNIQIQNGSIIIDDVTISFNNSTNITVVVEGSIQTLETDKGVIVKGNGSIGNVQCGGSVNCDNIKGDVECGGSVKCDSIVGNVKCGGSLHCDTIIGNKINT